MRGIQVNEIKQPLLSIITINYNDRDGLRETVESVLKQTFTDYEYLAIDGGSSDGSKEFLHQNKDRFAYWVSEQDTGIYNAMNKGIDRARGEYLLFLNSGDTLASSEVLESFINHPKFGGDIVYGDYIFEKGQKVYPDELYEGYFMKTSLPHQSTLFHNSVFEAMGPYDEQYPMCADRAFYLKSYLSGQFEFRHVPVALAKFDLSGMSNDPGYRNRKKEEDLRMLRDLYGDSYDRHRKELDAELKRKAVPKYSPKGIWKRVKKRIRDL